MNTAIEQLQNFIENWQDSSEQNKQAFVELKNHLLANKDVRIEFIAREGITYSLRATHINQQNRPIFVMLDVIEDQPRWLSVCFYGEMIDDPDEQGDFVPEGLLGEDAICFDVEEFEEEKLRYIKARMDEAYSNAAGQ